MPKLQKDYFTLATESSDLENELATLKLSLGHAFILINNVLNVGSVLEILVAEKGKGHIYWNELLSNFN